MWYYDAKSAIYSLDLDYRASHFCSNCAIRFRIVEEMAAHQRVSTRMGFFVTLFRPLSGVGGEPAVSRSISCFADKSGHLSRCLPTFLRLYPAGRMSLSISIHRRRARYLSPANKAPIQAAAAGRRRAARLAARISFSGPARNIGAVAAAS